MKTTKVSRESENGCSSAFVVGFFTRKVRKNFTFVRQQRKGRRHQTAQYLTGTIEQKDVAEESESL
jgi:hypothetical protein